MSCTVRTYQDNGPYWPPTIMKYQAARLKDMLFHIRLAMKDGEQLISVWYDDRCVGVWESDGNANYLLRRPKGPMAGHFNTLALMCDGRI